MEITQKGGVVSCSCQPVKNNMENTIELNSVNSEIHNDGSGGSVISDNNRNEISEIDIEDGLHQSGSFGRFQIFLQILLMYLVLTIGYISYFSYFILDDPPWKCINNETSKFCQENIGEKIRPDRNDFNARCQLKRYEWTYVTSKTYSIVTEFDLVCKKASWAAICSSAIFFGGIFGAFISGRLADGYGRKPVIISSLLTIICTSIGCSYVTNLWQLLGLRIVLGASWLPCFNISVVYLMEFVPPPYRAMSGLMYQITYCLSLLLVDKIAYIERHWRQLQFYVALPPVVAFCIIVFLPESPRWLVATNQSKKAECCLKKVARYNGKGLTSFTLKSVVSCAKTYTYLDLFRHWKITVLTAAQGSIWMASALVYFAIGLESSKLGGDRYQDFAFSALAELPGNLLSLYTSNRFGRKKTILGSLMFAGIFTGAIALIPTSSSIRHMLNVSLAVMGKFSINVAYLSIYIWTFELFPTVIRSQGLSVCALFERVGGLGAPFLVSMLQNVNYIFPFIFMFIISAASCTFGLTLPETNKMPTRENYEDIFQQRTPTNDVQNDIGVDNDSRDVC